MTRGFEFSQIGGKDGGEDWPMRKSQTVQHVLDAFGIRSPYKYHNDHKRI